MWAVDIDQALALAKATAEIMKRDRVLVTGVVELDDGRVRRTREQFGIGRKILEEWVASK